MLHNKNNTLQRRKNLIVANKGINVIKRFSVMKKRENGQYFIGVIWNESRSRWRAKYAKEVLGYFLTSEDAAKAYDEAAIAIYGKNAITNFKQKTNEKT